MNDADDRWNYFDTLFGADDWGDGGVTAAACTEADGDSLEEERERFDAWLEVTVRAEPLIDDSWEQMTVAVIVDSARLVVARASSTSALVHDGNC